MYGRPSVYNLFICAQHTRKTMASANATVTATATVSFSAHDALAFVSLATLSAAEVVAPSSLRLGAILGASSNVLLLALSPGRRQYLILSVLMSLCVGGYAIVRRYRPRAVDLRSGTSSSLFPSAAAAAGAAAPTVVAPFAFASSSPIVALVSSCKRIVLRLLPSALAAIHHMLALWILPFAILYGVVDAQADKDYFGQEVGHVAPATFYVVGLVILPLLVLPRGYESASVAHQLYESIFNTCFAGVYFVIFRTAHHFEGQDPPRLSAPNWDHEILGLVFVGAGLIGWFLAAANVRSSIHVTFPTLYVAYTMISHANAHHMDMSNMAMEDKMWKLSWMKLHFLHGLLFGVGALCRLVGRVPESMFFFYLGSFAFVTSAKWVVRALDDAVNYADDPESQAAGRYPTDHVIPLLVIASATMLYALFLGTAIRLRQFLDQDADVAGGGGSFEALPSCDIDGVVDKRVVHVERLVDEDGDEDEKKQDDTGDHVEMIC